MILLQACFITILLNLSFKNVHFTNTVESRKQVDLYYKSNLNITREKLQKHTMLFSKISNTTGIINIDILVQRCVVYDIIMYYINDLIPTLNQICKRFFRRQYIV